ncbi:YidH family protein [Streptomyces sp. NPDC005263]|uniref:YidH family protein n=1 Tax=Streptomyces sp. NPDC005263 TaxID=3364711 RepID=UPI003693B17A
MSRRIRPHGPRSGAAAPWHEEGEEPDYRFSLANERTFLAWIRTGLALLAGAVAVAQFVQPTAHSEAGATLGVLLAATGTVLCASSYGRWMRVQRAMRHNRPLPMTRLLTALTWGASSAGIAVLLLVWTAR